MLKASNGQELDIRRTVFPIFSFAHRFPTGDFKCLGTGFFIHPDGWFVTAKHTLFDIQGKLVPMPLAIHTLSSGKAVCRNIRYIHGHPNADLAIAKVYEGREVLNAVECDVEQSPFFRASFDPLKLESEIISYGYPNTIQSAHGSQTTFNICGKWSKGIVQDYHENGMTLLKNRCYQTTLKIQSGASGGPVVQNNLVVGVNSSGYDFEDEADCLSFITPIDYILDLVVPFENGNIVTLNWLNQRGLLFPDLTHN